MYIYLDLKFNQESHIAFTCPISLGFFGILASFYLLWHRQIFLFEMFIFSTIWVKEFCWSFIKYILFHFQSWLAMISII